MLAYNCYHTGKSVHKMEAQMKEMKEMKTEVEKMVADTRYVWKQNKAIYHTHIMYSHYLLIVKLFRIFKLRWKASWLVLRELSLILSKLCANLCIVSIFYIICTCIFSHFAEDIKEILMSMKEK